jgi:hypothetical protein
MNALHWIAGLIVLAEALNKLERACPFRKGLQPKMRFIELLKTTGWTLLAMGSGGAVATPLLSPGVYLTLLQPLANDVVLIGFAMLIIRSRVREGLPRQRRQEDKTP